ncbi:hypothetical protein [Burkholderia cepacia]|uniref:hypothetical protein n=1 Tax=Burkholderia cepacia TaxID=292 RepID=UPI0012D8C056|nr:hypothetical protein [Burkholderia cepacia]
MIINLDLLRSANSTVILQGISHRDVEALILIANELNDNQMLNHNWDISKINSADEFPESLKIDPDFSEQLKIALALSEKFSPYGTYRVG